MESINLYCNTHPGNALLLAILLSFIFSLIIYTWSCMVQYCGLLYKAGWKNFTRKWDSWSIFKQILFVLMYLTVILGWIVFGLIMIIAVIIVAVTAANVISDITRNRS